MAGKKRRNKRPGTSNVEKRVRAGEQAVLEKGYSGWIPPATGIKIVTLVSLVLALFVGWQTYQQTADAMITLRLAVVAGGSIWVIFAFVLMLTKFLRRT